MMVVLQHHHQYQGVPAHPALCPVTPSIRACPLTQRCALSPRARIPMVVLQHLGFVLADLGDILAHLDVILDHLGVILASSR